MHPWTITSDIARAVVIDSQCLSDRHTQANTQENALRIINKLGYVQIDTIHVIERAHLHTLWNRLPGFSQTDLSTLQKNKQVFEYWGHAMSYIPMCDYEYYLPRMIHFRQPKGKWASTRVQEFSHLFPEILKRIEAEGPLCPGDFPKPEKKKSGGWWDWNPYKTALELLFWQGELLISERRNFRKFYELKERVIPYQELSMPSPEGTAEFIIRKAVSSMGIASEKDFSRFLQPPDTRDSDLRAVNSDVLTEVFNDMVHNQNLIPVSVSDISDTVYYTLPETISSPVSDHHYGAIILSPFDNLIIQRDRVEELFNFRYSLECYKPQSKREFGYFVLPVLWNNTLCCRFDSRADRKGQSLNITAFFFEEGFDVSIDFVNDLAEALVDFALFNNCRYVELEGIPASSFKSSLKKEIAHFFKEKGPLEPGIPV